MKSDTVPEPTHKHRLLFLDAFTKPITKIRNRSVDGFLHVRSLGSLSAVMALVFGANLLLVGKTTWLIDQSVDLSQFSVDVVYVRALGPRAHSCCHVVGLNFARTQFLCDSFT